MPIALRKFGLELNRVHQEREKLLIGTDHRLGGEIKDLLDGLDAALWQFTRKAARNAFQNGKITESSWNRIARSVLNTQIMTPFHKFRDAANKVARRFQREAFTDTQRRMKSKFKELYPDVKLWRLPEKKYAELVDDLEFVDSKLELDYLTSGREVKESVWLAEIERIRGRLLEREITEVKEPLVRANMSKSAINLVIGTGKIDQDFKLFLRRQFDVGLDTHNLLSSFTTQQIGSMQSLFLAHVRRGIDTGVTRKQFVERFLTDAMTGQERRQLATNTMRTLRTAHQRAATASTSLWSMENKDLVTGLRRVANGRPCIACIMLDGVRYPPGATLVDHPNGMAHTDLSQKVITPDGEKRLNELQVGDEILSYNKQFVKVIALKRDWFFGYEYKIIFRKDFWSRRFRETSRGIIHDSEHDMHPSWPKISHTTEDNIKLCLTGEHPIFRNYALTKVEDLWKEIYEPPSDEIDYWMYKHCILVRKDEGRWQDYQIQVERIDRILHKRPGKVLAVIRSVSKKLCKVLERRFNRCPIEILHLQVESPHTYVCEGIALHNCVLVPEIKTLRELGFDESKVPAQHRSAFQREAAATPNMKSKFMALSEAEKRKVFANDKLFKLWKDEKLPLESLIVKRNGMFVPASARDVLARLPKLGGMSNPNASIGFEFTKIKSKPDATSKFFSNVDPTDRANKGRMLVKADDLSPELKRSAKFGDGTELAAKADPEVLVKAEDFIRFHKDPSKAPWYDWNEYARTLGLYTRKDIDGNMYFAIPQAVYKRLVSK